MELTERFRSYTEWRTWAEGHLEISSPSIAADAVQQMFAAGITEPITGDYFRPDQIAVGHKNYRETLSAGSLISRHRAILAEWQWLASLDPECLGSGDCKICFTEGSVDLATRLSSRFPNRGLLALADGNNSPEESYPLGCFDSQIRQPGSGQFDLLISCEDLQRSSSLIYTLATAFGILNERGVLIATFPFAYNSDQAVDPKHPLEKAGDNGSLKTSADCPLDWNMLDYAGAVGFIDSYYTLVSSVHSGVLGEEVNGVFVFVASKRPLPPKLGFAANMAEASCVPAVSIVAGLIGLPRSGTTVLTAAVAAHPGVRAVYEPWNSRKDQGPPSNLGVEDFVREFDAGLRSCHRTLLVKETAAALSYLDSVDYLLTDAEKSISSRLIWIVRDPMRTFLSEVEGRRNWWGEPSLTITMEAFDEWADRSIRAFRKILTMCARHTTICVRYEDLVQAPEEVLTNVMAFLGLSFEVGQLDYYTRMDVSEVRGDNKVAAAPSAISPEFSSRRAEEVATLMKRVANSTLYDRMQSLGELIVSQPGAESITVDWCRDLAGRMAPILEEDW